jgi:nucleoside-diphosphate-sugar epimerase
MTAKIDAASTGCEEGQSKGDRMQRVLIAGCGYVGGRLAELLAGDGREVFGLKRSPGTLPAGVTAVAADVSEPDTLADLPSVDGLVYAVSPRNASEDAYRTAYVEGLRNVLLAARVHGDPPARVILVSSTGVFGQSDGSWVDEDTPPAPSDSSGKILLEAESVALEADSTGIVLRLGGIYGPGRMRTIERVVSGEAGCPAPDRYGNRIHRDDAARAIHHLLDLPEPDRVYIGVDTDPAPLRDVYRWIAARAGVADPCDGGAREGGEATGRRGTNKRCSSARLGSSGFEFRFPSYREGYAPFIACPKP